MAGGLVALLDDIAAMAKLAAASVDDVAAAAGRASAKAAGVVVDDTAVTPRYVQGLTPDRELPIIKRIALGSLRNKLLDHHPGRAAAQPVRAVAAHADPHARRHLPLLRGRREDLEKLARPRARRGGGRRAAAAEHEKTVTTGAIRTDFILSAEIMVIALNEVADEPFVSRAVILVVVAIAHHGARLRRGRPDREDGRHRPAPRGARVGHRAHGRPRHGRAGCRSCCRRCRRSASSAMLWVGGHILLVGVDELGLAHPLRLGAPRRGGRRRRARSAGASTPSPRPSSAWSWGRSSWPW